MEEYPEELRSPPVPLISLVGCPDLHPTISTHLHSEQPPMNTLALPDFTNIAVIAKYPKVAGDPTGTPPAGILKKGWLLKHRAEVPAVVAALFPSDHVSGDPAQWIQLCTHVDLVKAVLRTRNTKLVVVVVQSSSEDDMNEERMIALRKRAEVDSKYFINFSTKDSSEMKQSLHRLATALAELVSVYYREEGKRVKTRLEKKNFTYAELCVCCCFKVGPQALLFLKNASVPFSTPFGAIIPTRDAHQQKSNVICGLGLCKIVLLG